MHPECVRLEDGLSCTFAFPEGVRLHRRLRFGVGELVWMFRIENPNRQRDSRSACDARPHAAVGHPLHSCASVRGVCG